MSVVTDCKLLNINSAHTRVHFVDKHLVLHLGHSSSSPSIGTSGFLGKVVRQRVPYLGMREHLKAVFACENPSSHGLAPSSSYRGIFSAGIHRMMYRAEWTSFQCHYRSMRQNNNTKVSQDATLASVKKNKMARPRMAKSARMAIRQLDAIRTSRPTIGPYAKLTRCFPRGALRTLCLPQ